ncbi:hypothetical protein [Paenibacillus illinoisensis]|uniref:dTMP kinase n=1 Tax=Paenibacillus illinoisensis TaxID=59845 RepID=UPI003016DD2F
MIIAFEGIHGCGKSTQIKKMEEWFINHLKIEVMITKWNSYPELTPFIDGIKFEKGLDISCSLAHALDFSVRQEKYIIPFIRETNGVVLSDRYVYTGLVRDKLRGISEEFSSNLYSNSLEPDIILYFDIDPLIAISRMVHHRKRTPYILGLDLNLASDITENFLHYLILQREIYLNIFSTKPNAFVLDVNSSSIEELFKKAVDLISSFKQEGNYKK